MPKGEHLAELNRRRAEERQHGEETKVEATRADTPAPDPAPVPAEAPAREFDTDGFIAKVDAETKAELERMRQANLALYEELQTLRAQVAAFPTAKPIVSKPLPKNYVVWLGPEPELGELYLSAKGTITTFSKREGVDMIDGDGEGKQRKVYRTQHTGVYGPWRDSGRTSIDFVNRCPANHKFAGRLWAEILCPEFAASLELTAGKDRDGKRMLQFFFATAEWHGKFAALVKAQMQRRQVQESLAAEVTHGGVPMPPSDD